MEFNGITTDPTGHYLLTANYGDGSVSVFSIDAVSGALTAISGSPFRVGGNPLAVTADVSGQFRYLADLSSNPGTVKASTINGSTGALTTVSGSPFAAGNGPFAVTTTGAVAASTATLQSLTLSPAPATITSNTASGQTMQFVLQGQYSDGTTKFLTESGT